MKAYNLVCAILRNIASLFHVRLIFFLGVIYFFFLNFFEVCCDHVFSIQPWKKQI